MDIGNNIKSIRKKNKLTQKDLADKLNKSVRMVQKYENGEVTPNIEVLKEISKILNVSLDSLLDTNEDNDIVTLALHNANGIDDELPEEAQKEIESFIEYIKQKYKK
ncbi:helix-turn-helix transcriptional regulator [Clostridium perfringens]|uniref:helix-turn-helix transcriptional regulator n=1 Tax=Clostridium perfringens TaxID=1502 RepID=UPI002979EF85|nr:helix-turn-helix transcriptional regulator [Clostridium perfringens]MDM0871837.1 helix-turn-helix transcriptional regulator [Clostridium perfringens]MDM0874811.1 helix-turn-helix transcriptional regulator [Clostridium perfringens]MDM1025275.1 helix-turn-helix transcriptional regulator [Clostridium perfringens]